MTNRGTPHVLYANVLPCVRLWSLLCRCASKYVRQARHTEHPAVPTRPQRKPEDLGWYAVKPPRHKAHTRRLLSGFSLP